MWDQDPPLVCISTHNHYRIQKNNFYQYINDIRLPWSCNVASFLRLVFSDRIKPTSVDEELKRKLERFLRSGYACPFSRTHYKRMRVHKCLYCRKFNPLPVLGAYRLVSNHLIIAENNIFLAVRDSQHVALFNVLCNSGIDAFLKEECCFYDRYDSFDEYLFQMIQSETIPPFMTVLVYEGTVFNRVVMIEEEKHTIPTSGCMKSFDTNICHMFKHGESDRSPSYLSLLNWESYLFKNIVKEEKEAKENAKRLIGQTKRRLITNVLSYALPTTLYPQWNTYPITRQK